MNVVWLPMMETDNPDTARHVVQNISDERAQHFFDPNKIVGKAIATSLGSDGHVAWDVYLLYAPGSEWTSLPPAPVAWMYQQGNDDWADPTHLREEEDLVNELGKAMGSLAAQYATK